jgi:glycosyltransferase involved in cell wall biosynthesis
LSPTVAFVTPRFGPEVVGGSEALMSEMALGMASRGWNVEVLTTTAIDHQTWASALSPVTRCEEGVVVRRFEAVSNFTRAGLATTERILRGEPTTVDEQLSWLNHPFRAPDMFLHLLAHVDDYDHVVLSPYLLWTTTVCLPVVAGRAVVVPCLHDEPYARLEVIRPVLRDPASVWFLSEPEHQLAHRLGRVAGHHVVMGGGVTVPQSYDAEGFRRRHGLTRPYILFAGRREFGKGWDWLLSCYEVALGIDDPGIDLVSIGAGSVDVPEALHNRVIDLGFLPAPERDNALAAASAYVQPSVMESFSRSTLESWLAGTPVLTRAESEVVAWHCARSGGGRLFEDGRQLACHLRWLADAPAEAETTAAAGRRYVLDHYTWDRVLDRIEEELG